MTFTINPETLLIAWLALSGAIVVSRGLRGFVREYTLVDALFAAIEIGFLIWLVTEVSA